MGERIARTEKEIKKLEEKYSKSFEIEEKDKLKKMIKMEQTTLNRMKKEILKYKGLSLAMFYSSV